MRPITCLAVATLLGLFGATALAQSTSENPVGEIVPYWSDSGSNDNDGARTENSFNDIVQVPQAAWLRLFFSDVQLGEGSFVQITSLLDNDTQVLDAHGLKLWKNSSAYFNGDALMIELFAGPNTKGNRIVVSSVTLEWNHDDDTRGGSGQCGICGSDGRTPSSQDWSGRILPVGCTGSVYTTTSCVVSAGHCASGTQTIQFRVPSSNANCTLRHPPANDQFPVTGGFYRNGGVGNDWMVFTTGTNGAGQRPYDRYGSLRALATSLASPGQSINIYGFGVDQTCTRTQTQQLSSGTVNSRTSSYYTFTADIRGGNSGSGLSRSSLLAGIVTHCTVGCPNYATRIDRPDFVSARNQACAGGLAGDGVLVEWPHDDWIPETEEDGGMEDADFEGALEAIPLPRP